MNTRRTCPEIEPSLTAYLAGDLPAAKAAEVREHLEHCPSCRALAQELAHTLDLLRDALAASAPAAERLDEARRARVLSSRPSKARRIWIGYLWPVARAALLVLAPLGLLFSLTLPRLGGHARYARTTAERAEEASVRIEAAMAEMDGGSAPSRLGLDLAPAPESRRRSAGEADFYFDHGTTAGGIGGASDGDGAPATAAPRAPLASTPLPAEPPAQNVRFWGMTGSRAVPAASAAAPAPSAAPARPSDSLARDKSGAMTWDESAGGYTIANRERGASDTSWKRQVDVKAAEVAGVTVSGAEPASGQPMVPLRTALPKPQFVGTPAPIKGVPHLEPESAARYNYAGGAGGMSGLGSGAAPAGPGAVNAPVGGVVANGGTLAVGGGVHIVTAPEKPPAVQTQTGEKTLGLGYSDALDVNGRRAESREQAKSEEKARSLDEHAKSDSSVVTRGLVAGRSASGREAAAKESVKDAKKVASAPDASDRTPALGEVPVLGTLFRADGVVAGKPMTPPPAPPPAPTAAAEVATAVPEPPTDPFALPPTEKPATKAPAPASTAARPAAAKATDSIFTDSDADAMDDAFGAYRGEAGGEDRAKRLGGRKEEKRDLSREPLGQQVALKESRSVDHAARLPADGSEAVREGIVAGDRLEVADLTVGQQKLNESEYLRRGHETQPASEITKLKTENFVQVERYDPQAETVRLDVVSKFDNKDQPQAVAAKETTADFKTAASSESAEPVPEIKLPPAEFNPYVEAAENAFSTFSIDVDTAAYTMSRKEILEGRAPAPETVRTEEFVNFFDYDYAAPAAGMFAVHTAMALSPFRPPLELLKIGVQGQRLGREQERAAVLTLVIDTSGSMNTADRLGLIRQSLHLLLDKLAPEDRVALVQFASEPRLLLEHTPASEKNRILAAVDSLKTSGSTQLEGGLKLGYETAARGFRPGASNRVLLMSDGVANLGAGDAEAILRTVEQFRKQGITCSVLGFGSGIYNDPMLEKLADKGDGQYVFIGSLDEARRVLVDNLAATLHVIASDVKIQVEFNPKRVKRFRQIGYENRKLTKEQFRDDTVDAGEVGSGQSVTALYDVELHGPAAEPVGTVRVRYRRADTGAIEEIAHRITATDRLPAFDKAPARYRLAAGVAEFAEKLRRSPYTDGTEFPEIENALRPAALELSLDSNVQDLVRLVEAARRLPVR